MHIEGWKPANSFLYRYVKICLEVSSNRPRGPMARRLTTTQTLESTRESSCHQEIVGSNPIVVNFFFLVAFFFCFFFSSCRFCFLPFPFPCSASCKNPPAYPSVLVLASMLTDMSAHRMEEDSSNEKIDLWCALSPWRAKLSMESKKGWSPFPQLFHNM